ncbi:type II toxin-antitoxin system HicA family toxin [Escherichia coli]|uniref:toxin HicA n=1 Tax=Escherichia coli TaxID=562 RepID=UPI0035260FC2
MSWSHYPLIKAVGGTIKNNNGSRRKFQIGTTKFSTHEPHPKNVMDKGAVAGLKEWFVNCVGVDYE